MTGSIVICPKALVSERKWQEELKRFDEQFVHLDGDSLRYCIEETHLDGVWPAQYSRAILPFSLFDEAALMGADRGRRHQRGLLELDPPPAFDLVIVDEAHHIRNPDTWAYRTARYFCDHAEAVILMSATPIQLGDNDLYNLLHLLRPDLIPGRRAFDQMAEPNPHLNAAIEAARTARANWKRATLRSITSAIATPWGRNVIRNDERLAAVHDLLESDTDSTADRLNGAARNIGYTLTDDMGYSAEGAGVLPNGSARAFIGGSLWPMTAHFELFTTRQRACEWPCCEQLEMRSPPLGDQFMGLLTLYPRSPRWSHWASLRQCALRFCAWQTQPDEADNSHPPHRSRRVTDWRSALQQRCHPRGVQTLPLVRQRRLRCASYDLARTPSHSRSPGVFPPAVHTDPQRCRHQAGSRFCDTHHRALAGRWLHAGAAR